MALKTKFLIDGIDRLGKSTLINGIKQKMGYHLVTHFQKPEKLDYYDGNLYKCQYDCFRNFMHLLENPGIFLIADRTHLGEYVYSPLYRNYPGDYVFKLERDYKVDDKTDIQLILLTEDFSKSKHFVDDGLSFDIEKREEEQKKFLEAYKKSSIIYKKKICVTASDGSFRAAGDILDEALG